MIYILFLKYFTLPFGEIFSAETPNWTEPASTIPLDFDSSTGTIVARPRNIFQSLGLSQIHTNLA